MSKKSRDIELFLFDIYVAILKIEDIRQEFEDADELLYDYRAWDSIIREFTIIGEASKHLINKKLLKDEHKIVPTSTLSTTTIPGKALNRGQEEQEPFL